MKHVLLAGIAALMLAPAADAKMCVKIATAPARPVAGKPTTIRVTALSIVVSNGRARPGNQLIPLSPRTQLNVRITPSGGQPAVVRVRRRADDASVLEGRFTFPSAGAWTLSWAAWPNDSNSACPGTKRVGVSGR